MKPSSRATTGRHSSAPAAPAPQSAPEPSPRPSSELRPGSIREALIRWLNEEL